MIVLLSTVLSPSIAMANKVYVVGDEQGWRGGVDYQAWAANKIFFVGDILVFRYVLGKDHVYQVDGPSFHNCSGLVSRVMSSGNDFIRLAAPGRQWFFGDHCYDGQKLVITVSPPPFAFPPSFPPRPAQSPSWFANP
ncbi:hypothetical protein QN277_004187 [Acacia crassicarpa]|uniref:Phytocyanin domain-containing protein n=1 Tax=Acacia crassicarpa TaxID=499986 RepID=A0AAE1MDC9_9FABA|nr:hypothetical protein QN277_004187 [Acacia crassicarpa]